MVDYNSQLELHRQELINEYSLKQAMGKMTDKELVSLMNCVPQEARPVIQKVREEKKKNWKTQKDDIYASLGIVDSNMSEGQVLATVQNMTAREWRQFSSTMYFSKSELAGLHSSLQTSQPQITEESTDDMIQKLPILKALRHEKAPVSDDLIQVLVAEQKLRKIIAQQKAKSRQNGNYFVLGRQYRQKQEAAQNDSDRQISKQYRKVSLRIHPDRYGDEYEQEFEDLSLAYQILKDPDTRADYVGKMFKVMEAYPDSPDVLVHSHRSYLTVYLELQHQESAQARYQQATTSKPGVAKFYLESQLNDQPPKAPQIRSIKGKTISVAVSVHRYGDQIGGIKFYDGKLNYLEVVEDLVYTDGWVAASITVPEYKTYQIGWKAKLRVGTAGQDVVETPLSAFREVEVEDPKLIHARKQLPGFLHHAKQLTASLRKESRKLNTNTLHTPSAADLEEQYWQLHEVIAKSRTISNLLWRCLETLGNSYEDALAHSNGTLEQLLTWIDTCGREKSQLDDKLNTEKKKESLKSFKHSMAALMEQGTLADWILNVKPEELINTGKEANRLYQLLTEGKKSNSVWLDSASLQNAATRTDLFSAKQCKVLETKATEAEARMLEETQRLLAEREEQDKTDKERQALEQQAKLGIPLRTTVVLQGLVKRADLNGSTGIYMGLAPNKPDRYIVRVDGIDMALLKANFRVWKQGDKLPTPAASWVCVGCTYANQGGDARRANCAVCGMSRVTKSNLPPAQKKANAQVSPAPAPKMKWADTPPKSKNAVPAPAPKPNSQQQQAMLSKPSNKNKQQQPSTKEALPVRKVTMWIPQKEVSRFIGTKGSNVKAMHLESGARISVDKQNINNKGCCAVHLEGSPNQIMNAQICVERFLQKRNQEKENEGQPSPRRKAGAKSAKATKKVAAATGSKKLTSKKKSTDEAIVVGSQTLCTVSLNHSVPGSISIVSPPPTGEDASAVTETVEAPPAAAAAATVVFPDAGKMDSLFLFLCQQASCLKCKPEQFNEFLRGQDIESLQDLNEAANDDDFLQEMLGAGLKGFKKAAFKRAAAAAFNDAAGLFGNLPTVDNGLTDLKPSASTVSQIHRELECPICYDLMTKDPVMASDGHTYERHAIETWFKKHKGSPEGIRSPKTNLPMKDLNLVSNKSMLAMAREAAARA